MRKPENPLLFLLYSVAQTYFKDNKIMLRDMKTKTKKKQKEKQSELDRLRKFKGIKH